MDVKDIVTLIQKVSDSKLTTFEYQEGETKLAFQISRDTVTTLNTEMVKVQTVLQTDTNEMQEDSTYKYITSPMVGTFYSSASEDGEPFIHVGDEIKKGQVIGIVEAMKLMNEIESPYSGVVEEILVENREMIGYEQVLVRIRP